MTVIFATLFTCSLLLLCQATHVCKNGYLSCGDLQCFNTSQKCDGKIDCSNGLDEVNCTDGARNAVTRHVLVEGRRPSKNNFAWLVTPFIFCLFCVYASYKCLKEGFCTLHRLRQRAAGGDAEQGGRHYFVLDRWSFHSVSRLPTSRLGSTATLRGSTHRQLILVTNHSFSVSLSDLQRAGQETPSSDALAESMAPPSYDEVVATQRPSSDEIVATQRPPPPVTPPAPPSLPVSPGLHNDGFTSLLQEDPDLPSYSEAAGLLRHVGHVDSDAQAQSESQL